MWLLLSTLLKSTMAVAHEWTHLGFEPTTSSSRAATKNYKAALHLMCYSDTGFLNCIKPLMLQIEKENYNLKVCTLKLKWQNSRHKILLRGPWSFSVRESLLGVSNILLKWNTYKSKKKKKNSSKGIWVEHIYVL